MLEELFRKEVIAKYGDFCWNFFDPRMLELMDWLREKKGLPMIINTDMLQQRAFRDNLCDLVKSKNSLYVSGHTTGKAIDFNFKGENSKETIEWIKSIKNELPFKIRIEATLNGKEISWVHIDLYTYNQKERIVFLHI